MKTHSIIYVINRSGTNQYYNDEAHLYNWICVDFAKRFDDESCALEFIMEHPTKFPFACTIEKIYELR